MDSAPIAHAQLLALGTQELIRFAREGGIVSRYPFGLDDVCAGIAEALHYVLRVETAAIRAHPHPADAPELESTDQLIAALAKWLDENGFELPDDDA